MSLRTISIWRFLPIAIFFVSAPLISGCSSSDAVDNAATAALHDAGALHEIRTSTATEERLVVCFDGTQNDEVLNDEDDGLTNVRLVFESLSNEHQTAIYIRGVGIAGSKVDAVTGRGMTQRVDVAIDFLSNHYNGSQEIYIFGFSRGAATGRMLANEIASGRVDDLTQIEIMGLWDTVAAIGLPTKKDPNAKGPLKEKTGSLLGYDLTIPSIVKRVYHFVAIDETREIFKPTLLEGRLGIEEVWFVGGHADVGGGWGKERRLADVSLNYMMACCKDELKFDEHEAKVIDGKEWIRPRGKQRNYSSVSSSNGKVANTKQKVGDLALGEKPRTIKTLTSQVGLGSGIKPKIHFSVVERIAKDAGYRPRNLIRHTIEDGLEESEIEGRLSDSFVVVPSVRQ